MGEMTMLDIMYNFENKELNLNDLYKGLDKRYKLYQMEYKDKVRKNSSRDIRDEAFLETLAYYQENENGSEEKKISAFYKICKFYIENLNSGFMRTTPELLKYIRLPLFIVFGLQNFKLKNPYPHPLFSKNLPLIDKNGNAADVIKRRLYDEIKYFCHNFENFKKQEYRLEIA
jgi:hypothetical protein